MTVAKESIKKVELLTRHVSSKQPEESLNLGVPLTWGKQTIKWTRSTVEKITSKISSWRMNCISQVGRNCLVKFVTNVWQTILLTLPSSQTICQNINKIQARFWWGKLTKRFCKWISWNRICKPSAEGGTGLTNTETMNLSLLSKLAFRIIANPHSLLALTFVAKYEKNKG